MGNKLTTEADRKRTPRPAGTPSRQGAGQQISRARGTATNNKKNPGKRSHKGG
jgi:hypothetical protein